MGRLRRRADPLTQPVDPAGLLDAVRSRERVSGLRLLGIDGPSGSGKSDLAALVAASAGCDVVPIEDFLTWTDLSGWWPRFAREVLDPLLAGRAAAWGVRDWVGDPDGDSVAGVRTAAPAADGLLVVEGVGALRPELAPHLSLAVWVSADPRVRLARAVARDGEQFRAKLQEWARLEPGWFARYRPDRVADIVLDTSGQPAPDRSVLSRHDER